MNRAPLITVLLCIALALAIAGCGDDSAGAEASAEKPEVTVPSGPPPKQIEKTDLVEGDGPKAKDGDRVKINYVGVGYDSGEEFEASWGREPYSFTLGAREVLHGWDKGIVGMKAGGRRELILPPEYAYGLGGYPPTVGHNETVIYVIDLVAVG